MAEYLYLYLNTTVPFTVLGMINFRKVNTAPVKTEGLLGNHTETILLPELENKIDSFVLLSMN